MRGRDEPGLETSRCGSDRTIAKKDQRMILKDLRMLVLSRPDYIQSSPDATVGHAVPEPSTTKPEMNLGAYSKKKTSTNNLPGNGDIACLKTT